MYCVRKQFSKQYGGKVGNAVMYKVRNHICRYQDYKRITRDQNRDYSEDTDRYKYAMRWYELIRSTLESWREMYPNDAEVIMDLYGMGTRKTKMTVVEICTKHFYSSATVYSVRRNFDLEIAFKAIKQGLIDVM